ncbi:MAG: hypothetical protein ACLP8V_02035 [Thermoplasmata archaeon]
MLTQRATVVTSAATAITVLVVVLLFVWPGYLSTGSCGSAGSPTETVQGRTYYSCTIIEQTTPIANCAALENGTWTGQAMSTVISSFTFDLAVFSCGEVGGTVVSVTEPNGTTYNGGTGFGGPATPRIGSSWFTPDYEAGIYQFNFSDSNVTLFVETGK